MSISSISRKKWQALSVEDQERIVRMAWEDRSTFESIEYQFGLSPNEVVKFMRTQLGGRAFERWRRRATQQGQLKHESKSEVSALRFKCGRQRLDGSTKGWK